MPDVEVPPVVRMHELTAMFQVSQAVFAVAELDVANALLSGPREVADVAAEVGADADSLWRIIRYLAQYGVFRTSGSTVELTKVGHTLTKEGPMRAVARYVSQTHYEPFGRLLHTVRTGEPAATVFYGKPFFTWVNENPELAALQNETMAGITRDTRGNLLEVFDLPAGRTVADIGGADGTLIVELLAGRPERQGIVFDLPSIASAATVTLRAAGLEDRVTVVAGDFFENVPTADLYVLSAVLHDWSNADALRILKNVAKAAPSGARLVLFEYVVAGDDAMDHGKIVDISMMGMLGGRERSETEWRRLLADGGFTLQGVVTGSGAYSALEAVLA